MIHALVISYNTKEMTKDCLSYLKEELSFTSYSVTVIDNGSTDGTLDCLKESFPDISVYPLNDNLGFARACNAGFNKAFDAEVVFFVNTDTKPLPGSIKKIYDYFINDKKAGIVSPLLLNEDLSVQNTFQAFPDLYTGFLGRHIMEFINPLRYPSKGNNKNLTKPFPVPAVVGAFLGVRAELLKKLQGFDERYFFFLEETDLCRRVNNEGFRVVVLPDARVIHFQGKSAGKVPVWSRYNFHRSLYQYYFKWFGLSATILLYSKNTIKQFINLILYLFCFIVSLSARMKTKFIVSQKLFISHLRCFPYFTHGISQRDFIKKKKILNIDESKDMLKINEYSERITENKDVFINKLESYLDFLTGIGLVLKKDFFDYLYLNSNQEFFISSLFPLNINIIKANIFNPNIKNKLLKKLNNEKKL